VPTREPTTTRDGIARSLRAEGQVAEGRGFELPTLSPVSRSAGASFGRGEPAAFYTRVLTGVMRGALMSGVVTITAAPSIDRSYFLDLLTPGAVHRTTGWSEEFAGKGVNVSQALSVGNIPTIAVVPLPSAEWEKRGAREWLSFSDASVDPRVSVTLLEPDGRTTKINQSPPDLTPADWYSLLAQAAHAVGVLNPQWVGLCGAVPRLSDGSALDIERVVALAHNADALLAIDTSGPALSKWARQGIPDLIKPNQDELAECVERELHTLGDVVEAAREVHSWGVGYVVVSLGADGMLGIHGDIVARATPQPVSVVNTIGAGDASLAGFLAHSVLAPDDFAGAIANAVAWGSAKVGQATSQLTSLTNIPVVSVSESFSYDQVLAEPGLIR